MMRAVVLLSVFAFACTGGQSSAPSPEEEAPAPDGKEAEEAPTPAPPAQSSRLAASHILIPYAGASRSKATRSKAEAMELAKKVLGEIQDGAPFEEMAKTYSEGPSGPRGGSLGTFGRGRMVPPFEKAVVQLEVGQVTTEPVETAFGYHLIRRDEPTAR